MGLTEIADGLRVTHRQEDRGVVAVDRTDRSLAERLREYDDRLPCTPEATATVVEAQARGVSVENAAHEAGVTAVTAAKALHRCGFEGVSPVGPTGREIVRDWLGGSVSRSDAMALVGCDEQTFTLAAYCETHDPLPVSVADFLLPAENVSVAKRDRLAETMSSVSELR